MLRLPRIWATIASGPATTILVCALLIVLAPPTNNWQYDQAPEKMIIRWACRHDLLSRFDRGDEIWVLEGDEWRMPGMSKASFKYFVMETSIISEYERDAGSQVLVGWPFYAIRSEVLAGKLPKEAAIAGIDKLASDKVALPCWPIVAGFVANSIVFALFWCIIFAAVSATKRRIRRKLGRCPICNYDLKRHLAAGCPECGWYRGMAQSGSTKINDIQN